MWKVLALCVFALVLVALGEAGDIAKTVTFANDNWSCSNAACTSHVREGQYQPGYQCAEFVSRSLVAGGWIAGLSTRSSQYDYMNYHHNGRTYDLLWVSHKQGGPLGLEDLLMVLGWKNAGPSWNNIRAGSVVMCTGAGGPYSHVAIGVANQLTDAHNMAHYHKPPSVYDRVDTVYLPP